MNFDNERENYYRSGNDNFLRVKLLQSEIDRSSIRDIGEYSRKNLFDSEDKLTRDWEIEKVRWKKKIK